MSQAVVDELSRRIPPGQIPLLRLLKHEPGQNSGNFEIFLS